MHEREDRLLGLLGGFLVLGAFAGASVTALTLAPAHGLAALPDLLGAGLLAMAAATGGLVSTGLAYALQLRRPDHRVSRALPLAFFFLGALVAPWTRLALAFPRFTGVAMCSGLAIGAILALSVRYAATGTNRISRVFAVLNAWQYGTMAAGIVLTAHPVPVQGLVAGIAVVGLARARCAALACGLAVALVVVSLAAGPRMRAPGGPPAERVHEGHLTDLSACRASAR